MNERIFYGFDNSSFYYYSIYYSRNKEIETKEKVPRIMVLFSNHYKCRTRNKY